MADKNSVHSLITEQQERMMIFDVYITGTVGITIALMVIYSLVNNDKDDGKYYKYATRCGITQSIALIILYLLKLLLNDLVIPIDEFMKNNISFASIFDSFEILAWSIATISFYYGYTFIYLSLFKKDKIDTFVKVLMVFTFFSTFCYALLYLIDDVLTESLKEISVTQKRDIYVVTLSNSNSSRSIVIIWVIALVTDFVYITVLLYKFISGVKRANNSYAYGIKAVVLFTVSSVMFIFLMTTFVIDLDLKYLVVNLQVLVSNICLFLMFKGNEGIYNNLCGCLCGKCCASMCFGSKYKAVRTNDDDEDEDAAVVFMYNL